MSTFVLVHGAWHGEWCWEKIIPLLQQSGHRVVTFDLPGHGKDQTPPSEVALQSYTNRLCNILDNESEKVILVGHSMGGIVITQTAEYRPEKIASLVYVAAFLPENGQSLAQILEKDKKDSPPVVIVSEDKTYLTLKESLIEDAFYGESSKRDVFEAKERLCPQPVLPFITPVQITEGNFGRVPRIYIETSKDKVISIEAQRKMHTKTPCRQVITMDTDHSPFFSQPEILASHLKNIGI